MLEKSGTGKDGRARERMERGDFLEKDDWARCDEDDRRTGRFTTAGREQGHRAFVIRERGVAVKGLVQLRRSSKAEGKEEGDEQTARDEGAQAARGFHNEADFGSRRRSAQGAFQRRSPAD